MDKKQLIELVELLKAGDESQFEKIYLSTNNRLYNYIFSLSDSLNNDDCYELVQETYIQVAKKIDTLNDTSKFMSWLFMIGRNKAFRYLEKRKKEVLISEENQGIFEQEKETEYVPEEILDSKEKKKMILDIIDSLPKDQKDAIYLRYYMGLSVKEISEKLNLKEGTIKSNLNYGRKKIKGEVELLEKKGTKLYGISSLPLLLLLLRDIYDVQAMEGTISENIYSNIAKECGNLGGNTREALNNGGYDGSGVGEEINAPDVTSNSSNLGNEGVRSLSNRGAEAVVNNLTLKGIASMVAIITVVGSVAYFNRDGEVKNTSNQNKPVIEEEVKDEEKDLKEEKFSFISYRIEVNSIYKVIKYNNFLGSEDRLDQFDKMINEDLVLKEEADGSKYYDYVDPMWLNDYMRGFMINVDNVIYYKEKLNEITKISEENRETVDNCNEMLEYFINNQDKLNQIAEKVEVIANSGEDSRAVTESKEFIEIYAKYLEMVQNLKSLL